MGLAVIHQLLTCDALQLQLAWSKAAAAASLTGDAAAANLDVGVFRNSSVSG
jgi:hypothetical protein